jgi:hypothetical protein
MAAVAAIDVHLQELVKAQSIPLLKKNYQDDTHDRRVNVGRLR